MSKTLKDLLMLGDPRLYQSCAPVIKADLPMVNQWTKDLREVMEAFRAVYHFGRAIAAPQIGLMKRVVYMQVDKPVVFLNPVLSELSTERYELWDDCMSFPNLMVKLQRHRSLTLQYQDENWLPQTWEMRDDLAELLQHECDHLEGVLCTMRAIDEKSYRWRSFDLPLSDSARP